jgi:hypothetical protein
MAKNHGRDLENTCDSSPLWRAESKVKVVSGKAVSYLAMAMPLCVSSSYVLFL